MTMQERAITVVGAGIVGVCSALYLQEKGFRVQILDRTPEGEMRASAGNAGILSPWSCVPESVPGLWRSVPGWLLDPLGPMVIRPDHLLKLAPWLVRFLLAGRRSRIPGLANALRALYAPTVDLYEALLRGTPDTGLVRRCVYLHVFRRAGPVDLEGLGWRLRRERGARLDLLTGDELREIEPDISPDFNSGVMIHGQGRATDPSRLLHVLTRRFLHQGGKLRRADVQGLLPSPDGSVTLQTNMGDIHAPKLVVAAGAWSACLLKPLGIHIPLESQRGYHLMLKDPGVSLTHTVMDADRMIAANMMEGGLRLAGTVELAGLTAKADYTRSRNLGVIGRQLFPRLNTGSAAEWMGHRPSLPDSLPVIDRAPGHPQILLAFGHSHLGLAGGAPTGRLIARLAADEPPGLDLTPYRATRF